MLDRQHKRHAYADHFEVLAEAENDEYTGDILDMEERENDMFDEFSAPEIDGMIEQSMKDQPKKFTFHCTLFLIAVIAMFILIKWASIKIN